MNAERKFILAPGMRGDILMLASDVEVLTGVPVRVLARLRKRKEGPRWERWGCFYVYRPAAVIDWLNERHAASAEVRHGA